MFFSLLLSAIVSLTAPHVSDFDSIEFRNTAASPDTLIISSSSDLIKAVGAHNRALKALSRNVDALTLRSEYASAYPDPTIMLSGQPLPIHTARGTQVIQLKAEQMIPYPGKRQITRQLAELEASKGTEMMVSRSVELILEAQLAFEDVIRLDDLLSNLKSFQDRLIRFESIATRKYEVGEGTQQAIWKLQLEQALLAQKEIDLRRLRGIRSALIQQIVEAPVRIEPAVKDPALPEGSLNPTLRSDFRALEFERDAMDARQDLEQLNRKPDLGVSATWMSIFESDIPSNSDGRDAFAVGAMIRIPLGRAADRARRDEVRALRESVDLKMESLLSTLQLLFDEQHLRLSEDLAQLRHIDIVLIPSAASLLESTLAAYANGTTGFLDLLDAERMAFQIQTDRIEVESRLRAGTIMLNRISGHLEARITRLTR